jgi:hypothetical protein
VVADHYLEHRIWKSRSASTRACSERNGRHGRGGR